MVTRVFSQQARISWVQIPGRCLFEWNLHVLLASAWAPILTNTHPKPVGDSKLQLGMYKHMCHHNKTLSPLPISCKLKTFSPEMLLI